jgi:FkbH-like protein
LDNTLWGGVVGDDGLEGIKIGQGNAIGEAYLEVQNAALALRDRGIILAVSSKNEDAIARSPFREHPDMLLKEEHISVFKANWKDKASNIEMIANELNIGLDSIVFFDDNPVERMQVRAQLPEVAVPELPSDVSLYARTLLNAGYFDVVGISEEDKQRASQYQANKQRGELLSQVHDLGAFLLSLEMKVDASHFLKISVPRVTQLINKTNQFNLTTKRYTESGIEELMNKPNFITLQVRLSDRFGDNGIISIGICEIKGDVCEIDTWLMSCRVFGRRVEEFQLAELVRFAESKGATQLVGKYIPTQKNVIVSGLYERLGFEKIASDENGSTWKFNIDDYRHNDLPFRQSSDHYRR